MAAAAAVAMVVVLLPAPAVASTAWVNTAGGISIEGGGGSSTISTDFGIGFSVVVKDTAAITASSGCAQSTSTSVVCHTAISNAAIEADLGDGDDTIGSLLTGHLAKAWGGPGNDRLMGDTEQNVLCGEAGADCLWGGAGADTLDGGAGVDQLIGDTIYAYEAGDGNDHIQAQDNERDEVLCGGGSDTVIADRSDDVYVECEHVSRDGSPGGTPSPPASTSLPAISGRADAGQTLTCIPGRWTGATSLAYRWLRDNAPITSGPIHRPAARDIGHTLTCAVTATNTAGSAGATSAPVRVTDRTPPVVRSLKSSGQRGRMIRLHYRVRDNSGIMRDTITVNRGSRQLKRLSTPSARQTGPRSTTSAGGRRAPVWVSASASNPRIEPATEATKAAPRSRCADRAPPVS